METWLRPNRRALALGMIAPGGLAALGAAAALGAFAPAGWALLVLGGIALLGGLATIGSLAWQMRVPRIGYRGGEVLFQLRAGRPIAVPVEVVEGFLLGQGPALLPGGRDRDAQAATVVARLSQRASEWLHVDVKPSLGHWCDGYVTIRGTWCEPLDEAVVNGLNRRLAAAHRAGRAEQSA